MRPRLLPALLCLSLTAPALLASTASAATADTSWVALDPIPISPFHYSSTTTLCSNSTGGALALIFESYNTTAHLVAYFFTFVGGWSEGKELNDTGYNAWTEPACALNDDGAAVAAWAIDPLDQTQTAAATYSRSTGWSAATRLSTTPETYSIDAAITTDGRAAVTWNENVTGTYRARIATRLPGQAWSSPSDLDTVMWGSQANLAAGQGGELLAAWTAIDGNDTVARFARFTPATGWSVPENASALVVDAFATAVQVQAARDGGAFVMWQEADLAAVNLSARHLSAGGTWEPIERIATNGFVTSYASATLDPGGNLTLGWIGFDAAGSGVHAVRHEVGRGWGATQFLGDTDFAYAHPALAAGEDGVVMAVWSLSTSSGLASYSRFVPGVGWGTPSAVADSTASALGFVASMLRGHFLYVPMNGQGWSALFDRTPPTISLAGPPDGSAFSYPVIDVTGNAEQNAIVTVSGVGATVNADGSWMARVPLGVGQNDLVAVAKDRAGNTATVHRTVRFDDPVPALEAALAQAQANFRAQQAALAAAQANVTAQQAALAAAQANLSTTNEQLGALLAALNTSIAEQQRLQAEINALNRSVVNQGAAPVAPGDGLALIVALLGVVLGGVGLTMGLMRRAPRAGGGVSQSAEPAAGGEHETGTPPPPRS